MDINTKKQLSAGIIVSYLVIVAQCISGLLYMPILLKGLGQSEYGIYSLTNSFAGYLTIFNSGTNAAYIRFYVQTKIKNKALLPKLNGTFVWIFLCMAAISFAGGIFLGWKAEILFGGKILLEEYAILKKSFIILAFLTSVTVINCIFSSMIIANEKFVFAKMIQLINIIAGPVLTLPFLINGGGSVLILQIKLLLAICMTLCNMIFCFRYLNMKFEFGEADMKLMKAICTFSGFIVIQGMMDQLNWQIDKFLLARFRGTADVSIYSVGTTFNDYYITISSAMSGVFIAEINRLTAKNDNKKLSDLFIKTSRIFAMAVLFIMSSYGIFGKKFIYRWAGPEYGSSYYAGLLIMLPVTFSLAMGLGQDIVRAKNIHKMQIVINFMVCILNLIISIPLAIYFGAVGSAFGTFVSEIIICIVIQSIYYSKVAKLDMRTYYREMFHIIPALLIPLMYGIVVNSLGLIKSSYTTIFIYGIIYSVLYFISMWLIAMNQQEKRMVQTAFLKVWNKFRR